MAEALHTVKTDLCKIPYVALSILLLFCCAVLSAQAITLNQPVTALSINADDSILAAAGADSLSVYETSSYSCISTIEEKSINHSRFYRVLNGELLNRY